MTKSKTNNEEEMTDEEMQELEKVLRGLESEGVLEIKDFDFKNQIIGLKYNKEFFKAYLNTLPNIPLPNEIYLGLKASNSKEDFLIGIQGMISMILCSYMQNSNDMNKALDEMAKKETLTLNVDMFMHCHSLVGELYDLDNPVVLEKMTIFLLKKNYINLLEK